MTTNYVGSLVFGILVFLWALDKLKKKKRSLKWLWLSLLTPWASLIIASILKDKSLKEATK